MFDERELDKLTKLCRIACTKEEKKALQQQIASVLKYIDLLKEVDTEGVAPCNTVLAISNILRDDTTEPMLPREVFLSNAPSHTGGMVRVPPVIKTSS